jgi:hypothetical protein
VELPQFGITIGSVEPLELAAQNTWLQENVRAIVNVTDSPWFTFAVSPWIKTLWFPIDEYVRWPTTSLFGAKLALDHLQHLGMPTFVHCSGGINRSRHIVALWLWSRGMAAAQACTLSGLKPEAIDTLVDRGTITKRDLKILLEANKSTFCLGSIRAYVEGDAKLESQSLG